MKKLTIVAAALLASTSVWATDLPNKKKAPAAAPAPVAAVTAAPASTDSLSVAYGQDVATGDFGSKTNDIYQLSYKHVLGAGFFVGGMAQTTQVPGSKLGQNLEAQAGLALPAIAGVTLSGKIGVGEKFSTTNFPYYAAYGSADYKVADKITLNAVQYRYRNAFDTVNDYQSHQVGTGVTFDVTPTYSVNAKVARNFDSAYNATGDQFMLGLTTKF